MCPGGEIAAAALHQAGDPLREAGDALLRDRDLGVAEPLAQQRLDVFVRPQLGVASDLEQDAAQFLVQRRVVAAVLDGVVLGCVRHAPMLAPAAGGGEDLRGIRGPARQDEGMPFTRAELASFQGRTVEDLLGDEVRLLFVGINPGLWTAATGAHFAHPGNRFYPALVAAGILDRPLRVSEGMSDADREALLSRGIGITNLAARATARADELTREELRAGAERLVTTVERVRPAAVALVGITAYRAAFGRRTAKQGRQAEDLAGVPLWVLPNPSGLNAHDTVASLGRAYREPARAAGIVAPDPEE